MIRPELFFDPTVTSINRLPVRGGGTLAGDPGSVRRSLNGGEAGQPDGWSESLDGRWDFQLLESPEDVTDELLAGATGAAGWNRVSVPGPWTLQGPDCDFDGKRSYESPHYTNVVMPFDETPPAVPKENPTGVYRRSVDVPVGWDGRRVVLRVGAAESVHQVVVDGRFIGGGSDSRLPSEFDLTDHVTPGSSFELAIVVAKWSAQTWLEDQDQWWHGGVQRGVSIYSTPHSYLAQVKLLPGLNRVEVDRAGADDAPTGTLAAEVVVSGPASRELGWTVEARVEALDASDGDDASPLARTELLPVPTWDSSSEAASLISAMFIEPGVVRSTLNVPSISPWSHETPVRYRSLIILRDPDGNEVHAQGSLIGFRSVEIVENELLINGAPVLLHGVNIHEHDPDTGRSVTPERTRADLQLMKAHNLNAVRAAHYPHDEHLAALCDELGLYLIDEANVESHGRQTSLCHDQRFAHSIAERVQRMAQRDQHHPSIIIWSLGNESGDGAVFDAAAAWLRRYDPTRPVQYEGPLMHDLYAEAPSTDIVCPMYSSIEDIVSWAEARRDLRRPLILCEYSHAMGNSNGSLSDYWTAFETTRGLQGGFIWEWLDHGLRLYDDSGEPLLAPNGEQSWAYGGDFGDEPNDFNFVCDGLVSADRVPRPAMAEVHHVGRPVQVSGTVQSTAGGAESNRRLLVENRRWFTGIEDLIARWTLSADGSEIASGDLDVPPIEPRSSVVIEMPEIDEYKTQLARCSEAFFTVEWLTRDDTDWAPSGHRVGGDQLEVTVGGAVNHLGPVTGSPGRDISPDRRPDMSGFSWRPTVFRALTDNDGIRHGWMRGLIGNLARWVDELGLDSDQGKAVPVTSSVVEHPNGWTQLQVEFDVPEELADLPRLGIEVSLLADPDLGPWDGVEWFGDGPVECYPDRRSAPTVGRWQSTVGEMYTNYALPQEHGHRTNMRWLSLTRRADGVEDGLLVVAGTELLDAPGQRPGFGVRYHSDSELWNATHAHELTKPDAQSLAYLYLDAAQRGLGTGSCGPDTLDEYRIGSGVHHLDLWLCRYDPKQVDPAEMFSALVSGGGVVNRP